MRSAEQRNCNFIVPDSRFPRCSPVYIRPEYSKHGSSGLVQTSGFLAVGDETAWPRDAVSRLNFRDRESLPGSLLFQEPWRTEGTRPAGCPAAVRDPGPHTWHRHREACRSLLVGYSHTAPPLCFNKPPSQHGKSDHVRNTYRNVAVAALSLTKNNTPCHP